MKKNILITFGCSWTFGVGLGYQPGMTLKEYNTLAWNSEPAEKYSFRKILCNQYEFDHVNFSIGSSSNQKQFRLAKNFFISKEFDKIKSTYNKIIVLWGITSTARNELYSLEQRGYKNFMYNWDKSVNWPFTKDLVKYSYDHRQSVEELQIDMIYLNNFFKNVGVLNAWFDTFNHHEYYPDPLPMVDAEKQYNNLKGPDWPIWEKFIRNDFSDVPNNIVDEIKNLKLDYLLPKSQRHIKLTNLLFADKNPRDILSLLSIRHGLYSMDSAYHTSLWEVDSNRVKYLVDAGVLNPHSMHPTVLGHEEIADILSPEIEKLLQG
jgi:hypothetical protein